METRNKQSYTSSNFGVYKYNSNYKWQYFLESFRNNRKLRRFVAVTTALTVGFSIIVVVVFYQLIVWLVDITGFTS